VVIYETRGSEAPASHGTRPFTFEPKYEESWSRTIWSLSNGFTSAFKELERIPQFKATAKLGEFLEARFSKSSKLHLGVPAAPPTHQDRFSKPVTRATWFFKSDMADSSLSMIVATSFGRIIQPPLGRFSKAVLPAQAGKDHRSPIQEPRKPECSVKSDKGE
jgi:hypothetical protein